MRVGVAVPSGLVDLVVGAMVVVRIVVWDSLQARCEFRIAVVRTNEEYVSQSKYVSRSTSVEFEFEFEFKLVWTSGRSAGDGCAIGDTERGD